MRTWRLLRQYFILTMQIATFYWALRYTRPTKRLRTAMVLLSALRLR